MAIQNPLPSPGRNSLAIAAKMAVPHTADVIPQAQAPVRCWVVKGVYDPAIITKMPA